MTNNARSEMKVHAASLMGEIRKEDEDDVDVRCIGIFRLFWGYNGI